MQPGEKGAGGLRVSTGRAEGQGQQRAEGAAEAKKATTAPGRGQEQGQGVGGKLQAGKKKLS